MDAEAWKRLKLIVRCQEEGVGVCFALLGKVKGEDVVIKEIIQVANLFNYASSCESKQVRKIESESVKQNLMFLGLLYAHPRETEPLPKQQEIIAWLSLMFKLDRPLLFFVISIESLKIAAYTIPPNIFQELKNAIKLVRFEVKR